MRPNLVALLDRNYEASTAAVGGGNDEESTKIGMLRV